MGRGLSNLSRSKKTLCGEEDAKHPSCTSKISYRTERVQSFRAESATILSGILFLWWLSSVFVQKLSLMQIDFRYLVRVRRNHIRLEHARLRHTRCEESLSQMIYAVNLPKKQSGPLSVSKKKLQPQFKTQNSIDRTISPNFHFFVEFMSQNFKLIEVF